MTTLRTLKKLLLGETWLLPGGLVATVAVALLARSVLGGTWTDVGGFVLLAGVSIVLVWSVNASARP
jgi:membrane protein implicated in regulation of membrane protease activity